MKDLLRINGFDELTKSIEENGSIWLGMTDASTITQFFKYHEDRKILSRAVKFIENGCPGVYMINTTSFSDTQESYEYYLENYSEIVHLFTVGVSLNDIYM